MSDTFRLSAEPFNKLLRWHLTRGTRPFRPYDPSFRWTQEAFAAALGINRENVTNWVSVRAPKIPSDITPLLKALFDDDSSLAEYRSQFIKCWRIAQSRKQERLLKRGRTLSGETVAPKPDRLAIQKKVKNSDLITIEESETLHAHSHAIERAKELLSGLVRQHNQGLSGAWQHLPYTSGRWIHVIDQPIRELAAHGFFDARMIIQKLGSLLELDDDLRKYSENGEAPLPPTIRMKLRDTVVSGVSFLRRFESVRSTQDASLGPIDERDIYNTDHIFNLVHLSGLFDVKDDKLLRSLSERIDVQGRWRTVNEKQYVGTAINAALAGAIAKLSPQTHESFKIKLESFFSETRISLAELSKNLLSSELTAILLNLSADSANFNSTNSIDASQAPIGASRSRENVAFQIPRTPFVKWREPVPGVDPRGVPEMVTLPKGSFRMGSPEAEEGSRSDERPTRLVEIRAFGLSRTAVTFAQWDAAVAAGAKLHVPEDRGWGRGLRPVINVSWEDALAYCSWLNSALDSAGNAGSPYRLPSEAEWEYACRAGTLAPFNFGDAISLEHANFDGNFGYGPSAASGVSRERTVEVGMLPANHWGLHEMHGNVWEWVHDSYSSDYSQAPKDGTSVEARMSIPKVIRGGSWSDPPWSIRSAVRGRFVFDVRGSSVGFRLARTF